MSPIPRKRCIVCGGYLRGKQRKYCSLDCARIGASTLYHKKRIEKIQKRIKQYRR